MVVSQAIFIALSTVFFSSLVVLLLRKFKQSLKMALFFVIPLFVFSLGFIFRLSESSWVVDLGFFLTEFSGLFVSILFSVCLSLGQLKYWKKEVQT